MRYYEAKFSITPFTQEASDLLAALIAEAGFESFDNDGDHLLAYAQTDLYNEQTLNDIIRDFPFEGVSISYELSEVAEQNWNATWEQQGFDPIVIDDRCIIYDANNTTPEATLSSLHTPHSSLHTSPSTLHDKTPLEIAIDAHQAFGTGTHRTTQMMVDRLLHSPLRGQRVLDCGCGTGILSIVASKCGASEVVAYDIDDWSVRNTQHNAELNGVENITVLEGNSSVLSHVSGVFDLVLANINRNILLADLPHFADVMQPHTHLLLSGFYEEDAPLLLQRAQEFQLIELCRRVTDRWMCLELVKN